jgi:hypothetical protein
MARRGAVAAGIFDLAGEFGKEFVVKHLHDAAMEYGIGLVASQVPLVGGVAGAIVDVKVAKDVTRLVGVMTLVYLENPAGWIGTKTSTYKLIRAIMHEERRTPISALVEKIVRATESDALSMRSFQTLREQFGEKAGAVVDALVYGVPLANDADNVSQAVLDGLDQLKHGSVDFNGKSLDDVSEALNDYRDHGWAAQFAGHVAEMVAHEQMPGSTLPESASQSTYDITDKYGVEWQVKTGKTALRMAREHLEKHPDTPVITNEEAAEALQTDHPHAVGMNDLDTDHLRHLVDSTTVSIQDLVEAHPTLPIVATILAARKEALRWRGGEISALQMVGNIGVRVGSRSACIFIVTSTMVLLATGAGVLAGAGPLIAGGAIVGGMLGNEAAGEILDRNVIDHVLSLRLPVRFANQLVINLQAQLTTS